MTPFLVGIAGGTASGKTTVALRYAARADALLISHDRYYRDFPEPRGANFDHPDSLETTLLVGHLRALRAGLPADLPVYHFPTHRRVPTTETVHPRPVVVVEGILVLADAALRACFDLRVYVDAPDDIRLIRRLRRDVRERGRTMESVVDQYLATVRPMHERFVAPSAVGVELLLVGTEPIDTLVDRLAAAVAGAR